MARVVVGVVVVVAIVVANVRHANATAAFINKPTLNTNILFETTTKPLLIIIALYSFIQTNILIQTTVNSE